MPLYEYRCRDCQVVFERRRSLEQAAEPDTCDSCGNEAERIPSVFASKVYTEGWSAIAPLDANGRPMSKVEAAKAGLVDDYVPDERERALKLDKQIRERRADQIRAEARRDAYKERYSPIKVP